MDKKIIDVCCGSRMFWEDKNNKDVLFCDIRSEDHILCDGRKLEIRPDILMDFRKMDFPDKSFKMVVFDPPHLKNLGSKSWMAKKYGILGKDWKEDLAAGFMECWRILDDWGTLVFKWSEKDIAVSEVLGLFPERPLFGHISGRNGRSIWACYVKIPENINK
jgi:hypothetical protein